MTDEEDPGESTIGISFLGTLESHADRVSAETDRMARDFGEKLPATLESLGKVMKLIYWGACCGWGCRGGDHQVEWLAGRVVNEAMSAYRLARAGFYDESLMLTRAIGEIANLLWLFEDTAEFEDWRTLPRRERLQRFSPRAVRERLQKRNAIGAPIGDDRYRALCEVGVHPVPGNVPGHFTGTGRPILGHILQPAGLLVATTELGYAVAMCALPMGGLLDLDQARAYELKSESLKLVRSLGAVTIFTYDDTLVRMRNGPDEAFY